MMFGLTTIAVRHRQLATSLLFEKFFFSSSSLKISTLVLLSRKIWKDGQTVYIDKCEIGDVGNPTRFVNRYPYSRIRLFRVDVRSVLLLSMNVDRETTSGGEKKLSTRRRCFIQYIPRYLNLDRLLAWFGPSAEWVSRRVYISSVYLKLLTCHLLFVCPLFG